MKQAEKIAEFILNHQNLPIDMIPYWDFNASDIPNAPRDASAAAIIASALLELQRFSENKVLYIETAKKIMESLSTDKYLAKEGTNNHFILKHSTGSFPHNSEIDVPLVYADYYFLNPQQRKVKNRQA